MSVHTGQKPKCNRAVIMIVMIMRLYS